MRHSDDRETPVRLLLLAALCLCGLSTGCAALSNPVGDAVPVRLVPPELLGQSRNEEQTISLSLLGQPPPDTYRLGPGDVLGVFIDGILGDRNLPVPLNIAPPVQLRDQRRLEPSLGYPVEVQADGTVSLPRVVPLRVVGLSVAEARDLIRDVYVKRGLVKPELDRVLVTLLQQRQVQVLVFRQEGGALPLGPGVPFNNTKRGTGHLVELQGYENDVLHALALTGGLPGLDAYNAVVVQRGCFRNGPEASLLLRQAKALPADKLPIIAPPGAAAVRIPLRQPPGQPLPIHSEDVVLHNGDVVFLEARDEQVFFSGGLLPPGAYILPRDHDLDVVEAVALVRGPFLNGSFGGSNLSGAFVQAGIGNPSPTHLVVLRRTPGGGQVPILVDLGRALRDPRERVIVQAGDVLILQEKPEEALARYITQTFFNFNLNWEVLHEKFATGLIDVSAPDRLPGRLSTINTVPR
jgi:protein involved in polysaccharide export with SLBB domain